MKAPTMPGAAQDVFDGACPSCVYSGMGKDCGRRSRPNVQQRPAPDTTVITSAGPPLENSRKRHRRKAAQEVAAPPQPVEEYRANSVPADGQSSQGPKHKFQDLAIQAGIRARTWLPRERKAMLERFESLLGIDGLKLDELDMARCVLELPVEERFDIAQMMLKLLRPMLD